MRLRAGERGAPTSSTLVPFSPACGEILQEDGRLIDREVLWTSYWCKQSSCGPSVQASLRQRLERHVRAWPSAVWNDQLYWLDEEERHHRLFRHCLSWPRALYSQPSPLKPQPWTPGCPDPEFM